MTDHADAMQDGVDALYEVAGVACSYADSAGATPAGAVGTPTVVVEPNLGRYGDDIEIRASAAVIRVRKSEVENIPEARDVFTITADSKEWVVYDAVFSTAWEHGVLVT